MWNFRREREVRWENESIIVRNIYIGGEKKEITAINLADVFVLIL